MHATRKALFGNARRQQITFAAGTTVTLLGCCHDHQGNGYEVSSSPSSNLWKNKVVLCETISEDPRVSSAVNRPPSWLRRSLAMLHIKALPVPRLIVPGDPIFSMDKSLLRKRHEDEVALQGLVMGALRNQERDPEKLAALNEKALQIAYGEGMTIRKREDFVLRHGCSGWTDEVLDEIILLAKGRGIVEIGAGNGQWARALIDRYEKYHKRDEAYPRKEFHFVLAYDDKSELPLDEQVYHKATKAHRNFFYDKVKKCDSNFSEALRHFQCRGRVLMIVYPPPGSMAVNAVTQYTSAATQNDTIIYVGEGRGGANADGAFFDLLESGEWVLLKVLPVKPLGSKGYEKLYVVRRNGLHST